MHLLPVLLAENILQQTIHKCFACKQKNKGGKEKGFSGDMYVQTISNTPVHFSKNSKQKFEYKTKKVFWHHLDGAMTGKQTVSFLYLYLIFAIHSVNSFFKSCLSKLYWKVENLPCIFSCFLKVALFNKILISLQFKKFAFPVQSSVLNMVNKVQILWILNKSAHGS